MGLRLFVVRRGGRFFREARNAGLFALSLTIAAQPALAGTASWTPQSFAPGALGGQAGAQQQSANTNSLASNLGKAAAVLSMAAGGLYMAKGATQLKCCTSTCSGKTGTGSDSKKEQQDIKKKVDDKTDKSGITSRNDCPVRVRLPLPFLLSELFRPAPAQAEIGACLDALIALTTGGIMMLTGIMSLQAAQQADQMANNSLANAGGMGSIGPDMGTSPTGSNLNGNGGPGSSSFGTTGSSQSPIKLDPALLRTGKANDIMNQFENKFGIPRDQFANGVLGGQDPRKLLGSAPQNALSNADMNRATSEAKAMSDADKAKALAGTPLNDAQRELASKVGAEYAVNPAGGVPNTSGGLAASLKKKDAEPEELAPLAAAGDVPVSPEVKDALAAKELEDRKNGITDLSIFEVVHQKYREKSKYIFGFDPDNLPKGVLR